MKRQMKVAKDFQRIDPGLKASCLVAEKSCTGADYGKNSQLRMVRVSSSVCCVC